jgi:predicted tellurium resistance membrane protein TerC
MIVAVIIALAVMMIFAGKISRFVNDHPTIKMLALSFLVMIGVLLVAEAFHKEIEKGYIYFSMVFALGVELLNMRMSKKGRPVRLRTKYRDDDPESENETYSTKAAKKISVK